MSYLVKMIAIAVLVASACAQDDCKTSNSGGCYWTELQPAAFTLDEADSFCVSHGSVLAVIYDEKSYNEVVEDARNTVRENNPNDVSSRAFWLRRTYDPANNKMYPVGAYNGNWNQGYPKSNTEFTGVVVAVRLDTQSSSQGLTNVNPNNVKVGIVCWKLTTDECKTSSFGGCYWTEMPSSAVTLDEADSFCAAYDSVLAVIYDEQSYDEVVEDARNSVRENNPNDMSSRGFWLGRTYDPANNKMYPYGAYDRNWNQGYPKSNTELTGVVVAVRLDTQSSSQGLMNVNPNYDKVGVVCWKPATVPDTCNPEEDDYLPDPTNPCSGTFYQCSNGVWVERHCPGDQKFNVTLNVCDYEENVAACNTDCKTSTFGECYWTEMSSTALTLSGADNFCASYDSALAMIYDEQSYDEIIEDARTTLRENNPNDETTRAFWLGQTYDALYNKMYPVGAYDGNWASGYPYMNTDYTAVAIQLRMDPQSKAQGLINLWPKDKKVGVVCWKLAKG